MIPKNTVSFYGLLSFKMPIIKHSPGTKSIQANSKLHTNSKRKNAIKKKLLRIENQSYINMEYFLKSYLIARVLTIETKDFKLEFISSVLIPSGRWDLYSTRVFLL